MKVIIYSQAYQITLKIALQEILRRGDAATLREAITLASVAAAYAGECAVDHLNLFDSRMAKKCS